MNIVQVDESSFDRLYSRSTDAAKDFLYMLFEINLDCLPTGDWSRAELGAVDPFEYLDIAYEFRYQFRSEPELSFLRRGAALNLICRLAWVVDEDETSGSTWLADFQNCRSDPDQAALIGQYHPELFHILEAFEAGRVVSHPTIHRAFRAALYGTEDFRAVREELLVDVVQGTFHANSNA